MMKLKHLIYFSCICLLMLSCNKKSKKDKLCPTVIGYEVIQQPEDIVFGKENAPKTIFMYASYQCTYCRYFFSRTLPDLKKNYLDNGKIKLIIKLVDFNENPQVLYAYQAASCISRFGIYEKFHPLLLANPDVVFSDDFSLLIDDIMDRNPEIEQCILNNNDYLYLRNNVKEFRKNNLTGTPTFVINNHAYSGFYSYESFSKLIKKELNTKEQMP